MAEAITIARPYAEAVFKLAREEKELSVWSEMLDVILLVISDKQISAILNNPRIPADKLSEVIIDSCSGSLNKQAKNLITVMADNKRLQIFPQLKALYEQLRARDRKSVV